MTKQEIVKSIIESLSNKGFRASENHKGQIEISIQANDFITYAIISKSEIDYQYKNNR